MIKLKLTNNIAIRAIVIPGVIENYSNTDVDILHPNFIDKMFVIVNGLLVKVDDINYFLKMIGDYYRLMILISLI